MQPALAFSETLRAVLIVSVAPAIIGYLLLMVWGRHASGGCRVSFSWLNS
jgi:hypothetical protein